MTNKKRAFKEPSKPVGTVAELFAGVGGFRIGLAAAGWKFVDSVNRTTKFLLVPDDAKETTKIKAARAAGVQIVLRSAAESSDFPFLSSR